MAVMDRAANTASMAILDADSSGRNGDWAGDGEYFAEENLYNENFLRTGELAGSWGIKSDCRNKFEIYYESKNLGNSRRNLPRGKRRESRDDNKSRRKIGAAGSRFSAQWAGGKRNLGGWALEGLHFLMF